MSVAKSHMETSDLKINSFDRLNANSIKPVVLAVKKSAARQVIKHGKSGKLQDLINFVMLGISHKESIKTSEIYAEPDMELAKRIAEETG